MLIDDLYCVHVCCPCVSTHRFISELHQVNRARNHVFIIIIVILYHLIVSQNNTPVQGPFLWNISSVITKLPVQTLPKCRHSPPDGLLPFGSAPYLIASLKSPALQLHSLKNDNFGCITVLHTQLNAVLSIGCYKNTIYHLKDILV